MAQSCLILLSSCNRHRFWSVNLVSLSPLIPTWFQQPGDLDTQFSKFNAVNVVPGPQDISLIDAIVCERNTQISTLALQMANVDTAIRKLAAIRVKLEENSARVRGSLLAHKALTAPARRIPPEVLSEIFYHCLPKTPYITPRDAESPLMLARVCHYWRAVTLSTPRLWSSLSIPLQNITCEEYRHGYKSWLARAKSVPLTIRVLNDTNLLDADPTLVASVVHWLRPVINQSSDLWWHGPSFPALFVSDTEADLPTQRLRITAHREPPAIHFPGPATHLRSASLQFLNYDLQSLDGINLPWDNLVELNMHFALFSSTLFVQLLTRCTHLRTLIASCLCADEDQLGALRVLPPGSITHPWLRRIEIKVIRAGLDVIFDTLTLPALEELDVCFCYRERDAWPHAAFTEMIGRSRCTLKRLAVRSNKTVVSHFEEYMAAMPGLAIFTNAPHPLPH